jgi:hypothetical protein
MWPFSRKASKSNPNYAYYVVENSFVARVERNASPMRAERLGEDGQWQPYDDVWDVHTNGRYVDSEAAAIGEYREILALRKGERSK